MFKHTWHAHPRTHTHSIMYICLYIRVFMCLVVIIFRLFLSEFLRCLLCMLNVNAGEQNMRTDTMAKKAYERSFQKVWSQWAHDKKKLKKVNVWRWKDGLPAITLKQLTGRGGAHAVAAMTPSPPSALPAVPTQRRRSRRLDISTDTDITAEQAEGDYC